MVTRHRAPIMYREIEFIRGFQNQADAPTAEKNQKTVTVMYVLLKVTTCLYLNPSNKARSLSTLIAVNVSSDTAHKV